MSQLKETQWQSPREPLKEPTTAPKSAIIDKARAAMDGMDISAPGATNVLAAIIVAQALDRLGRAIETGAAIVKSGHGS